MKTVLPAGLNEKKFEKALDQFRSVIGDRWVLASDNDRKTYLDPYALGDGYEHMSAAALSPSSTEEVQAIVRIANEYKVPLWPIGRGKNLGYGGAAPMIKGTVVLDMGRMNKIIEVDEKFAHCVLEPGVGYFDLYDHLKENNIPLWMSVPGNAWGSVIGNALERGIGYTPYGDNCDQLCGLEVVLPQGDLIKTGMGAMKGSKTGQHYKYGFGPGWDQMFVQSNFGIVTKAGVWLQPEPEMTAKLKLKLPHFEDVEWAIDVLAELRRRDVIQHNVVFGNYLHDASVFSHRSDWYEGDDSIPDPISEKIMEKFDLGWWTVHLRLFGYAETVESHMKVMREMIEPKLGSKLEFEIWQKGDPVEKSARGIPSTLPLQTVNWYGGRGGHVSFAPVMPPDGKLALKQATDMRAEYKKVGHDYYTSFTMGKRHINNVNLIVYDRDNESMVTRVQNLFTTLVSEAAKNGYAEYRAHIDYMQTIADTYDFNDHALLKLNEQTKKMLDPNNIIAPGKNGIGGNKSYLGDLK